jgi:hypothetical protein
LRALSRQLTWIQAAEIFGCSARSIRRLRLRYQQRGYDSLLDHRRQAPLAQAGPGAEVERMLRLYRERYQDFNVRHFVRIAQREHHVTFCYAFIKKALQGARGWCLSSGRGSPAPHPSRSRLGAARHRTHPRLFAPGPGAQ